MNEFPSTRRFVNTAAAIMSLLAAAGVSRAQVIENPKNPPSPNAGRVVSLKEVARITDEKGKFFFVQPFAVFAGRDGSVYVQEFKQLLKFDPQGRFVKNLLKKGSGPGELNDNLTDVLVLDKEIVLWSSNCLKLIRQSLDGRLIEDRTSVAPLGDLLGTFGGRYFFLKREVADWSKPRVSGIFENVNRLIIFNERGEIVPTPVLMPCTASLHFRQGSVSMGTISRPMPLAADDRTAFLFHSPNYLIKLLDLEKGEVVRSFRRDYDRVKYAAKTPPGYPAELVLKFHNDLCRLLWRNGRLWAVTSTIDPKKGILVDVFSREGRYLDNFYLPLFKIRRNNPQLYAPMAIHGNFLYVLEADEDDLMSLIKYEIVGN
jgi:hypothetical protein